MSVTRYLMVSLIVAGSAFADAIDENAVLRHRELEARLKAEEAKNAQILDETVVLEKGAAAFRTAAELMTGVRKGLPPIVRASKEIAVYESDVAAVFERGKPEGKSAIRMQGLDLEGGVTYRFTADVSASDASPAKCIKFGLRVVKANGKIDWPGAAISNAKGTTTFTLGKASFDYRMPHGARAVLIYGLSAPATGSVSFLNVKVERL